MEEVKQEEDLLKNNKLGFLHAAKRMKMEIQQYRQRDNLPEDYEQIVDALPNLDMLLDEQRLMMWKPQISQMGLEDCYISVIK